MDDKPCVPVLEFEFITQFKGTEAVSKGRECEQLADGGQHTPVNNPHRRHEETANDEGNGNNEAGSKDDATRATPPFLALAFDVLNITHVFILRGFISYSESITFRYKALCQHRTSSHHREMRCVGWHRPHLFFLHE